MRTSPDSGRRARVHRMTTCLLVIDMIGDFLGQHLPGDAARLVLQTNDLARSFRENSLPIVWVRQEFAEDLSDAFLEMRDKGVRIAIAGTPGSLIDPRLEQRPGDLCVVKKRYSAFFGTNLDAILRSRGIGEVVIAGVNTHACVRTAAIDAYQRDLRVILASDCVASYDREHARVSMSYMDGKIARAMSNAQIREHLECPPAEVLIVRYTLP